MTQFPLENTWNDLKYSLESTKNKPATLEGQPNNKLRTIRREYNQETQCCFKAKEVEKLIFVETSDKKSIVYLLYRF